MLLFLKALNQLKYFIQQKHAYGKVVGNSNLLYVHVLFLRHLFVYNFLVLRLSSSSFDYLFQQKQVEATQ